MLSSETDTINGSHMIIYFSVFSSILGKDFMERVCFR